MIDLKKLAKEYANKPQEQRNQQSPRSFHLTKELHELQLPKYAKMRFPKQGDIREIEFLITPEEGLWKNGNFLFNFKYPTEYNIMPPYVRCLTKTYHPIIEYENISMSIQRRSRFEHDGGWTPLSGTIDIIQSLFFNFMEPCGEDALNVQVGILMLKDYDQFKKNVEASFRGEIVDGVQYEKQPINYDFPENVKTE
ncbi:MAG: putative NEDD8-conjugating enzyme Ubc12 [Streblomastix strix]|uniref:Putative NEDD8-conjugating enzyme Ubc12 n=1 Tax=Streblomastix strix TaxID=222440 RepID=A0A5J4W4Q8_9EUKA|nr:MAG: putative NEDD8-conjugating enzyme Ubc12 [Streblomastix strix]